MRVCAITNVYNEAFNLPIWLKYYGAQLGEENCLVLDHGSDDGSTSAIGKAGIIRLPRTKFDDIERANLVSSFANGLLEMYDAVLYADCDEIVVADPRKYSGLVEFCEKMDGPIATTKGLNIKHNLVSEDAIDPAHPILSQRSTVQFVSPMCKPSITREKISWGGGFHSCDHRPSFGELYLFHLRDLDLSECLKRLRTTKKIEFKNGVGGGHQKVTADAYVRRSFLQVSEREVVEDDFTFVPETERFLSETTLSHTNRYHLPKHFYNTIYSRIPSAFRSVF